MSKEIFIDDFLTVSKSEPISLVVRQIIEDYGSKGWKHTYVLSDGRLSLGILSPEGRLWDAKEIKMGFQNNGHDPKHGHAFRLFSALYWDLGGREFVNLPEGFYALDNKSNTPSLSLTQPMQE